MRVEPMIAVRDVESSSTFYENLLGARNDHGGSEFGRLVVNGAVVLLLHHWGDPAHRTMRDESSGLVGHGLVLYFRVEHLGEIEERIERFNVDVKKKKTFNQLSHQYEIVVSDPDGYEVVLCSYGG